MISFKCQSCGQAIQVMDDMAGKQGKCPKCGEVLSVPASAGAAAPQRAAPAAPWPQAAAPGNSPPPAPWGPAAVAAPAKSGALAITALVVSLAALPLLAAWGAGLLFSLAALALGIVAWVRNSRARRGLGMAIAATVVSGCTIVFGGILVAILVPVIGSALGEARKSSCMANLKTIGSGIREYERSQNTMPSKPWDMVDAGYLPSMAFKCGADKDWQHGQSSYFFLWSTRSPDEEGGGTYNAIIACDLKHNHDNGRAYLTRAGNVGWQSEQQFQQQLARPENAAFAAALRAFEATGAKHVTLDQTPKR